MIHVNTNVFPTTTKLLTVLDNKKNEGRLYYVTSKRKLFVARTKYVQGMDFRILTEVLLLKRDTQRLLKQERRRKYKQLMDKLWRN